jgi:hypothetical protein
MSKFVSQTFTLDHKPIKIIDEADVDLMVFLSASSASVRIGYGPTMLAALFLGNRDQMILLSEERELWAAIEGSEPETLGIFAFPN